MTCRALCQVWELQTEEGILGKYVSLHYHGSLFFLNCVAHIKTLENTDLGEVPSNVTSGSLTFQGLLGSAARPLP